MFETTWELLILEKYCTKTIHLTILEFALKTRPLILAQIYVSMVYLLAGEIEVAEISIATIFAKFERSAV